MSDAPREARSYERIELEDLTRLRSLAEKAFHHVCRPSNKAARYAGRCVLMCFCQGAALHHVQSMRGDRHTRGIHDFDVWGFFPTDPVMPFPFRWRGEEDFGPSRFGKSPGDRRTGRKVDVIGRSIDMSGVETPVDAVRRWLAKGGSDSPREIRKRPVFVISAGAHMGQMIWPGMHPDV